MKKQDVLGKLKIKVKQELMSVPGRVLKVPDILVRSKNDKKFQKVNGLTTKNGDWVKNGEWEIGDQQLYYQGVGSKSQPIKWGLMSSSAMIGNASQSHFMPKIRSFLTAVVKELASKGTYLNPSPSMVHLGCADTNWLKFQHDFRSIAYPVVYSVNEQLIPRWYQEAKSKHVEYSTQIQKVSGQEVKNMSTFND